MRILVLNPGSSTLKYRLLDVSAAAVAVRASGMVDQVAGEKIQAAARAVLLQLQGEGVEAVGCRVVHGGSHFREPTRVTAEVVAAIRELARLAPLHNPPAVDVLDCVLGMAPGMPIVAVFDTAFHATMPEEAALYALPLEWTRDKGLRKYGFHGTSHQYVATRLAEKLGASAGRRLITCHLGNGASVCAVRDGASVDTTMGLTPLAGLMMGTRAGDVDPGLVLHLLRSEGMSVADVDRLLNKESGLLGVGGHADMRALQTAATSGEPRAELALTMFAYRVRLTIGAYAAALSGVDAIAFTGGIGEHSAEVRARVCRPLAWLGIQLDEEANRRASGETCITVSGSPVQVWVIATDEEGLIARETARLLGPQ